MCAYFVFLPVGIILIALGIDLIRGGNETLGFIVLAVGGFITWGLCKLIKAAWDDAGPPKIH